ncbi:MAG: MBL fold metallo-hydrolase [Bacteroidaceae bacterium]|nr:MBL fold metallo-hydrolase [Bacteroidaceae bacterium]
MKLKLFFLTMLIMNSFISASAEFPVETFTTPQGRKVNISLINHGSIAVEYDGCLIQIDPVSEYGGKTLDYDSFPKADIVLVTHEHGDHLNASTIESVSKEGTVLLLNAKSRDQIGKGESIGNGETRQLLKGIRLESVPAYNSTPGRERFHPKGNGNGYILDFDGLRVYISGDTEDIPEMSQIKDIYVAFMAVNQPYTMTVDQCLKAARTIAPKVLIPYHTGQTDLTPLEEVKDIDIRIYQELK